MEIHEGDEITIVFDVTPENTKIGFVGFNERGLIDIREVHAKLVSVNGKNFENVYILRTKIDAKENTFESKLFILVPNRPAGPTKLVFDGETYIDGMDSSKIEVLEIDLGTKIELNSNGEVGSLYMEGKAGRVKVNGQDIFENPLLPYLRKIIKPIAKELASLF